jgi:hypothetical protein
MVEHIPLSVTWQFWTGFVAFMVVATIGHFQKRKETEPLMKEIIYFKYLCIAYGIFLSAMMLALPPTEIWAWEGWIKVESFQDVSENQRRLGLDINRLREILQWTLLFAMLWLFAIFNMVKAFAKERFKNKSDV